MLTLVHNHFSFLMIEPDHWLQQKLKNSDSLLRLCDVISTFYWLNNNPWARVGYEIINGQLGAWRRVGFNQSRIQQVLM